MPSQPVRACFCLVALLSPLTAQTRSLEAELEAIGAKTLAVEARRLGDARRGAVVFYQRELQCTRCHIPDKQDHRLGPDLSKFDRIVSDEHLVESVLSPSKVVREGYDTVVIETQDESVSGFLVSDEDGEVVIRDATRNYKRVRFAKSKLKQYYKTDSSAMPSGLVNMLTSRQQFLDLVRYLMEIRDGGSKRAFALEPDPSLYADRPVPAYEADIDHAGFIRGLDQAAFRRGKAIYERLCVNCHGTRSAQGSLPTALRFAQGQFKNGNDPYTIYQTLTRGFGMMNAQTWMVPSQKYDVAHYVRKAYLESHNPTQYFAVDDSYLSRLPKGKSRGPRPSSIAVWEQMDYGPNQTLTLEIGKDAKNFAYKGNAVRLDAGPGGVAQGRYWMVFDTDTMRVAAAWQGKGFIDWNCIHFNGRHAVHPRLVGDLKLANPTGPGWGRPADASFEDTRLVGRDGRIYGPLPREWAQYTGIYHHGPDTIFEYTVGKTRVLEMLAVQVAEPIAVFKRVLNIGARAQDLVLQVAHSPAGGSRLDVRGKVAVFGVSAAANATADIVDDASRMRDRTRLTVAGVEGDTDGLIWSHDGGNLRLRIPAGDARRLTVWFTSVDKLEDVQAACDVVVIDDPGQDLTAKTNGGPVRWPHVLTSEVTIGGDDGPFAIDVLSRPTDNPWFCRMRLTGFDFTPDGKAAIVSAWDGSIWKVTGLDKLPEDGSGRGPGKIQLTWRRIASGLFQPLGVKIVDGKIYVTCRDQIAILHDKNGDEEIDYIECFNGDHQVTDHFHEFAMGLQTDKDGNFYYAKSARHAKTALVPHHGTLLRVSKDGSKTEIVANGFRAANGVCINPDGTFIVTDQEGHWNPKNRINYVRQGGFYGNMYGYHDVTDSSDDAMQQPLVWITNSFDRSPGELLWVDSRKWGPLNKRLLNLSYGYGMVYIVPHERVDGQEQGGMCAFPIKRFPTGVMRGRFHPGDGQLYLAGMFAWAGSQTQPGGLYRLRYTGKPVHLPVELSATKLGVSITLSGKLDRESATSLDNYVVKVWSLKRTKSYGSKHYDEHELTITGVRLDADGQTIHLELPDIAPTWSMEIRYKLKSADGKPIVGKIHNTIYKLRAR